MNYSLGNIISNGGVLSRFNPIAVARINAIYAAGGSAPVGQRTATQLLSDFINAEQSSGRWTQHRRIFIPGFGNAAANAIDIVGGTSGSFPVAGGVTHGAGFVEYNGTSGYLSTVVTMTSLGMTGDNCSIGFGSLLDVLQMSGNRTGGVERFVITDNGTSVIAAIPSTGVDASLATTPSTGHIIGSSTSTTSRAVYRSHSGGFQSATNTTLSVVNLANLAAFFGASNNNGTPTFQGAVPIRHAFCHIGLGLTQAQSQAFASNLRTLWQGLFQLSLP